MARSHRLVLSLIVGFAVAAPAIVGAQAVPRTAPPSSGSSGGGGTSGGTVSGPTSGGGGGDQGGSRSAPSSVSAPSRGSGRSNPQSRGSAPRSTTTERPATPGGVISGAAVSRSSASSPSAVAGGGSSVAATRAVPRGRSGVSAPGTAVPRPPGSYRPIYVSYPYYGPWGWYYPWFGPGFGWSFGWAGYNPYWYAGTYWGWGRYGYWYDPFTFGGYYPYYSGGGGGGGEEPRESRVRLGSIRLKVNPGHAKVYIDGVLYGVASEFSGLSDHLELEPGRATLELQAEGYETLKRQIVVEAGRTLTERATLTRKK